MEKRTEIKKIIKNTEETVPNDFAVACNIYETTEIKKELTYFKKIVEEMELNKITIDRNIDKLFDLGILCGNWNNIDGRWLRTFKIHPDALRLVENIYCDCKKITKEELQQIK